MNKLLKFGFTLAAGLVISACGSSGGGGDNNTSTTTPAANSTTTPSRTSTQPTVAVSSTVTGGAIVFGEGGARIAQIKDPSLTTLKVDGKQITIISSNVSPNAWSDTPWATGSHQVTCCGKYEHVRFGFYFDANTEGLDYFFYNGTPTTAMPTSGRATYRGDAIIELGADSSPATKDIRVDYPQGTSNFNVDFGAKTLTGSLNFNEIQAVNINANIANNSFKGSANSASLKGTARVEGKFYGENAKELGGFFENEALDDSFWNGVFGAIKQ